MNRDYLVECICRGVTSYLRSFALADCMELRIENGAEWISPKPGCAGPSLVFGLSLNAIGIENRIDTLIKGIMDGSVPSMWFVSPDWTPGNIVELLSAKGFRDLSNSDEPEPAMALSFEWVPEWRKPNPDVSVRKVQSSQEFSSWCAIANEVLHGWDMVTAEHYSAWLAEDGIAMYLAYIGDVPIATASTIRDGDAASLEFVATLKEYRNRGAASAICMHALNELRNKSIKIVTLRAFHDGISLYSKLGFKIYYTTVALSYQDGKGT